MGRRLNYLARRNFVVRVTDLPKQFGFELAMGNIHYEPDEEVSANAVISSNADLSRLYFVFNINDHLLEENLMARKFNPSWVA